MFWCTSLRRAPLLPFKPATKKNPTLFHPLSPAPQPCTDTPTGSVCGPCPRGWTTSGSVCVDTDGCAANPPRKSLGSTTPCWPGVTCTDLPAQQDTSATGAAFTCVSRSRCDSTHIIISQVQGTALPSSERNCPRVPSAGLYFCKTALSSRCGACPAGSVGTGRDCYQCPLAVPAPTTSFATAAARAATVTLFGSAVPPATAGGFDCSGAAQGSGLSWSWTLLAQGRPIPLSSAALALPTLIVPPQALPAGTTVQAVLQACYAAAPGGTTSPLCSRNNITFPVVSTPVAPVLTGGNARVSAGQPVVLNASASVDPDGAGPLSFTWECFTNCRNVDGSPLVLAAAPVNVVTLKGAGNGGQNYTIRLTVKTTDGRSTVTDSWLSVVTPEADQPLPVVSVQGAPGGHVAPSARLVLFGSAASGAPGGSVATNWSLASAFPPQSAIDLSDPSVVLTPPSSPSLVIAAGKLFPSTAYVFRLTASDTFSGQVAFAEVAVTTGGIPSGGSVSVSPSTGLGMNTTFTLSAPSWVDDDMPLLYRCVRAPHRPPHQHSVSMEGVSLHSAPPLPLCGLCSCSPLTPILYPFSPTPSVLQLLLHNRRPSGHPGGALRLPALEHPAGAPPRRRRLLRRRRHCVGDRAERNRGHGPAGLRPGGCQLGHQRTQQSRPGCEPRVRARQQGGGRALSGQPGVGDSAPRRLGVAAEHSVPRRYRRGRRGLLLAAAAGAGRFR